MPHTSDPLHGKLMVLCHEIQVLLATCLEALAGSRCAVAAALIIYICSDVCKPLTRAKSQQALNTSFFVCHTKHDTKGQLETI